MIKTNKIQKLFVIIEYRSSKSSFNNCYIIPGETLNIRDAYSHPLFYKRMDERTGFRTK